MLDQNAPESKPNHLTPTRNAPYIATILKIIVSNGMEIKPAQTRGEMTRCKGSTAIISILDNCSVAFIKPISAVTAEPARPANNNAVTTGPNSRVTLNATNGPNCAAAPNFTNV